MKTKVAVAAVIFLALIGLWFVRHGSSKASGDSSVPDVAVVTVDNATTSNDVMAEGTVTPSGIVNVNVLPGFTGTITHLYGEVGEHVSKGQLLAELDPSQEQDKVQLADLAIKTAGYNYDMVLHPHRPEEIASAKLKMIADEDAVRTAEDQYQNVEIGTRPQEITNAETGLESSKLRLKEAQLEADRNNDLYSKNLIPLAEKQGTDNGLTLSQNDVSEAEQSLSLLKDKYTDQEIDESKTGVDQAKLTLAEDKDAYQVLIEGSRPEQIELAATALQNSAVAAHQEGIIYSRHLVYSPISGTIVARNAAEGETGSPVVVRSVGSEPLTVAPTSLYGIAADNDTEFTASVDQMFYHSLHLGQPAEVRVEAMPGRVFHGTITQVTPIINPDMGRTAAGMTNPTTPLTFTIKVKFNDGADSLVAGQVGYLQVPTEHSGLSIPLAAVSSISTGDGLVFVVNNDTVNPVHINYEQTESNDVHVLSGLKKGDRIVVSDTSNLKAGEQIHVVDSDDSDPNGKAF